jgi:arabinose-5-phosphate isomerase
MKSRIPDIPNLKYRHNSGSYLLIAGPCVIESEELLMTVAGHLCTLSDKFQIPLLFKSSYRKANRSRGDSFAGIGDIDALKILSKVRGRFFVPVITDIHNPDEAEVAAGYADVLQIPAFLCRQTDLLIAAAHTGKWINIKKGQFLSGEAMKFAVEKILAEGNRNIMLTERGTTFGYQDLVVDFRNIPFTDDFVTATDLIFHRVHNLKGKLVIGGMGKVGQIAENIATTFCSTGTPAVFLHPSEAQHGDLGILQENDVLLVISNSGKTREILELIDLTENLYKAIPVIAITGAKNTPVCEKADCVITTGNPKEVCPLDLTPTTSTTAMTVIGDILVVLMMEKIGFSATDYAKRHHSGYLGAKSRAATKA